MTLNAISKRCLGRTEIEITPVGLGVMQFAGGRGVFRMMFPDVTQERANEIVRAALDGGINWFDTAELYGRGRSEQRLANALRAAGRRSGEVVVATKWSPFLRTARSISRTIDERMRFLGEYTIDLYMVHQPMSFSSPEAEMDAMADLVEQGKIRSVGVSNFDAGRMRRAHAALERRGLSLAANQVQYNLLHRKIETNGVLDAAKELGVTIISWSPLASGLLTGKYHRQPELLEQMPRGRRAMLGRRMADSLPLIEGIVEIAARYDVTPAQVALNWLVNSQGETVVAIPGATCVEHAEENAGALEFALAGEDMARLDELSRQYR
jgi:aryl-alcohol dehydrogenase-like predicted oxidoreductase